MNLMPLREGHKIPKKTQCVFKSESIEIYEPVQVYFFFTCKYMYASMPTGNSSGNNQIFLLALERGLLSSDVMKNFSCK